MGPTVNLRYLTTFYGKVCILRLHCSMAMTSQWVEKIFFAKFYIPTDTRYNFRFWISGMIFAWQRVEKRDKHTDTHTNFLELYIVRCVHFWK